MAIVLLYNTVSHRLTTSDTSKPDERESLGKRTILTVPPTPSGSYVWKVRLIRTPTAVTDAGTFIPEILCLVMECYIEGSPCLVFLDKHQGPPDLGGDIQADKVAESTEGNLLGLPPLVRYE